MLTWRRVPVAATVAASPSPTCDACALRSSAHDAMVQQPTATALSMEEADNDSAVLAHQALALSTAQAAANARSDDRNADDVSSLPPTAETGAAEAGPPTSADEPHDSLQRNIGDGGETTAGAPANPEGPRRALRTRPVPHAFEVAHGATRAAATVSATEVEQEPEATAGEALESTIDTCQSTGEALRDFGSFVVSTDATDSQEQPTETAAESTIEITEAATAAAVVPAAVVSAAETADIAAAVAGATSAATSATSTATVVLPPLQRTHGFQAALVGPTQSHGSVAATRISSTNMEGNASGTSQPAAARPSLLLPLQLPLPLRRDSSGSGSGPGEANGVINTSSRSAANGSNAFVALSARSVESHCSHCNDIDLESSRSSHQDGNSGASVDSCDWLNRGLLAAMAPRATPRPSVAITPRGVAALDQLEQICCAHLPNLIHSNNGGGAETHSTNLDSARSGSERSRRLVGYEMGTAAGADVVISPWVSPAPSPRLNLPLSSSLRAEANSDALSLEALSNDTTFNTGAAREDEGEVSISPLEPSSVNSGSSSSSISHSSHAADGSSNDPDRRSHNVATSDPCRARPPQHPPPRAPKRPSLRPSQPTRLRTSQQQQQQPRHQRQHHQRQPRPQQSQPAQQPSIQPQRPAQRHGHLVAPELSPRANIHVLVHPEEEAGEVDAGEVESMNHSEGFSANSARPPLQALPANVFNLMRPEPSSGVNSGNPCCSSTARNSAAGDNECNSTGLRGDARSRNNIVRGSRGQVQEPSESMGLFAS